MASITKVAEFGKRRVTRWLMSEEQARPYKAAVKIDGSLEIRASPDVRLEPLAAHGM